MCTSEQKTRYICGFSHSIRKISPMNPKTGLYRFYVIAVGFIILSKLTAQDITHFSQNKSSLHGNLSATAISYGSSGITPRKAPFAYVLSGNLNADFKGIVLPFSFVYSNQNKDFRQPFNQFGISPQYKWITAHLGYRNISFSKYVLGGHTILGGGLELNPGKLRFGIVYGRLQRHTNHAVKVNNPLVDTLAAFKRKVLSFKIGMGTKETFVDFIFLKGKDDSTSIDPSAVETGMFPATNLVGGLNTRIKLSENIHFEAEGSYSVFTNNQNSIGGAQNQNSFITINASTQMFMALRSSLKYHSKKGLAFGIDYRRIDPGFKSMGIYFINNDLENFTFSTGFRILKRKMSFKGSFGLERNNLKIARNATTKKLIGSANISYDPVHIFGINLSYSNYSLNQSAGRVQIADSVKLYQTNSTVMIMPHFQFQGKGGKTNHFINFLYTHMGLNDKSPTTKDLMGFKVRNILLSYNLGFIKSGLGFLGSINLNTVEMSMGNSTNNGFTIGVTKSAMKQKLNLSIATTTTQSKNTLGKLSIFSPVFNASMKLGKHHNFRLKLYFISNKDKTDNSKTFTEQTGDLSYVFTF